MRPALTAERLLNAYAQGIFPMAESRDDPDLFWVDPRLRGVLPLDGLHVSRSLRRRVRRGGYEARLNRDFAGCVAQCAARDETWINTLLANLYDVLHGAGHAHSVEIWREGEMIGGVFGVTLGGAFFGESMFSRRADGSKLALVHAVDLLRTCGFTLFDTQFLTAHLASLGGVEIARQTYRRRLADALERDARLAAPDGMAPPHQVLQRMTQTS